MKNPKKLNSKTFRIALYGGSFNPPHLGHLEVVRKGLELLPIKGLIVVPTYQNPLKSSLSAPPELRLKWCKKVFGKLERVEVSDWEIKKGRELGREIYSYEMVDHFSRQIGVKKPFFIIGADNLSQLTRWKKWKQLLQQVELVVATRKGKNFQSVEKKWLNRFQVEWILPVEVDISATQIRNGEFKLIPPSIADEVRAFYSSLLVTKIPK